MSFITPKPLCKKRKFSELIESAAPFAKDYMIVTITPDTLTFFRASDSVRVESMFEFQCYAVRFSRSSAPNLFEFRPKSLQNIDLKLVERTIISLLTFQPRIWWNP